MRSTRGSELASWHVGEASKFRGHEDKGAETPKRGKGFWGRYNYFEINSLLIGGFGVSLNQHEPHCIKISQNQRLVLDYKNHRDDFR